MNFQRRRRRQRMPMADGGRSRPRSFPLCWIETAWLALLRPCLPQSNHHQAPSPKHKHMCTEKPSSFHTDPVVPHVVHACCVQSLPCVDPIAPYSISESCRPRTTLLSLPARSFDPFVLQIHRPSSIIHHPSSIIVHRTCFHRVLSATACPQRVPCNTIATMCCS